MKYSHVWLMKKIITIYIQDQKDPIQGVPSQVFDDYILMNNGNTLVNKAHILRIEVEDEIK